MSRSKIEKCQDPFEDCQRTDIAGRGLCGKHLQRYKYRGTLDEVAPIDNGNCEVCDQPITSSKFNVRFCGSDACRWARMAGPRLNENCLHCGKPLTTQKRDAKWCDEICGHLARSGSTRMPDDPRLCGVCGNQLSDDLTPWNLYCSPECSRIAIDITNSMRRAQKKASKVERVDRIQVAENYGWICQLCFAPIDPNAPFQTPDGKYNPWYLHRDHIVPLSRGGEHSYANCQPSHARCNLRKNNRMNIGGKMVGGLRTRSKAAKKSS